MCAKQLDEDSKLKCCRQIRKEMLSQLVEGADGMYMNFYIYTEYRFRWVVCQLKTLRKYWDGSACQINAPSAPKTLDGTYIRILQCIDEYYWSKVRDIFALIAFSGCAVTLGEIVEFVAFNASTKCFDEEEKFHDPLLVELLDLCV